MEATQKKPFLRRFIGDRKFYKMILAVAIPIMIQNGITNFVSLLDNIMIGRVGTEQMSGAAIVNQLFFVYYLCIFGGVSGAGIFTAQYFGQKDYEGVRNTFRFKFWMGLFLTTVTILLFIFAGNPLIEFYLKGEGAIENATATLQYGREYMLVMLLGLPAFMFGQIYASTLRESGKTLLPMVAGIISISINLVFNYLLIFGKFGFPKLGVTGAAIATVLSRYVEMLIIVIWSHKQIESNPYLEGLYKTFKVPGVLVKKILVKGTPLLLNETLWAAGIAMVTQCYSIRSLNVMAALNISNTINNVFNVVFIALGDTVAIVVGQLLGAGKMDEARETDTKMIAFSVTCCSVVAFIMFLVAPAFPNLYNTTNDVKELGKQFIMLTAIFMPQNAFLHASYFTLRSGGKTIITFFFDSGFIWAVSVTLAFLLSRFTNLPVIAIYTCVQIADIIKCVVGFILVKKGIWLQNIVSE